MRKDVNNLTVVVALAAMLALGALASGASAAACNAGQLAVCAPAIMSGAKPTTACCSNLRSQQGCFCQFAKNPTYSGYINSPNARKAVASCGINLPHC